MTHLYYDRGGTHKKVVVTSPGDLYTLYFSDQEILVVSTRPLEGAAFRLDRTKRPDFDKRMELAAQAQPIAKVGQEIDCPMACGERHKLDTHETESGYKNPNVLFFMCGNKRHVGAVNGQLVVTEHKPAKSGAEQPKEEKP